MLHDPLITQIVETLEEQNPDLITALGSRVHNAKDLVQLEIDPGRRPTIIPVSDDLNLYHVQSQENYGQYHRVNVHDRTCTCPDAAAGRPCKHRLAVYIYNQILAEQHSISRDEHAYLLWKSVNPGTSITFDDFQSHPHHGSFVYDTPHSGKQTLHVLASEPRTFDDGGSFLELIAIQGSPFSKMSFSNTIHVDPDQFIWGDFSNFIQEDK